MQLCGWICWILAAPFLPKYQQVSVRAVHRHITVSPPPHIRLFEDAEMSRWTQVPLPVPGIKVKLNAFLYLIHHNATHSRVEKE